jgi:hypothetical protein
MLDQRSDDMLVSSSHCFYEASQISSQENLMVARGSEHHLVEDLDTPRWQFFFAIVTVS